MKLSTSVNLVWWNILFSTWKSSVDIIFWKKSICVFLFVKVMCRMKTTQRSTYECNLNWNDGSISISCIKTSLIDGIIKGIHLNKQTMQPYDVVKPFKMSKNFYFCDDYHLMGRDSFTSRSISITDQPSFGILRL